MITLNSVTFAYGRADPIVEDLSWDFPLGDITAITGTSGKGKSTLLYLIGLLLTPTSGKITANGRDLSALRDRERSAWRAARVGFVFQDAALDPTRTVLENVIESAVYNGMSRRKAVSRAQGLLDRFDVALRADHRPGEVSGGQAQRVALCRALLNDPDLILADEPTGNLDTSTANVVIDSLRDSISTGKTVIIATHDPIIVSRCNHVLEL